MGEWYELKERPHSPCEDCPPGFCRFSYKVENRKLYAKKEDCRDTCQLLKAHIEQLVKQK